MNPRSRQPSEQADTVCNEVAAALSDWSMLHAVNRLGVGVSGGADSLCLLDCLVMLDLGIEILPIHVLQHPRSQRPADLAAFIAERHGLPLEIVTEDVSAAAASAVARGTAPCRVCAPARAARFGRAAAALRLDALALGHHLDDAAATLLMNIFHRGTVDTMRPVARRREHPDVALLRPLLFSTERDVKLAAPTSAEGLFDCGVCSVHAHERARAARFVADMFDEHGRPEFVANVVRSLAAAPHSRRRARRRR